MRPDVNIILHFKQLIGNSKTTLQQITSFKFQRDLGPAIHILLVILLPFDQNSYIFRKIYLDFKVEFYTSCKRTYSNFFFF